MDDKEKRKVLIDNLNLIDRLHEHIHNLQNISPECAFFAIEAQENLMKGQVHMLNLKLGLEKELLDIPKSSSTGYTHILDLEKSEGKIVLSVLEKMYLEKSET